MAALAAVLAVSLLPLVAKIALAAVLGGVFDNVLILLDIDVLAVVGSVNNVLILLGIACLAPMPGLPMPLCNNILLLFDIDGLAVTCITAKLRDNLGMGLGVS